jgi:hypothetical protein
MSHSDWNTSALRPPMDILQSRTDLLRAALQDISKDEATQYFDLMNSTVSDRSAACSNDHRDVRDLPPLGRPCVAPEGGGFGGCRDHYHAG